MSFRIICILFIFTAEAQRTQSLFVLLFSVERTENNKKQALWAFKVKNHRVATEFFLLPSSLSRKAAGSTAKENYLYFALFASLR